MTTGSNNKDNAVSKRIVSEGKPPLVLVSRVVPLVTSLETSTRRLVLVSRVVTSRNKTIYMLYIYSV